MAILRGFPPSGTIGPGVQITEIDNSFVPPASSFHRSALVGFATKGPINLPTTVSSTRELYTKFGYPNPSVGDPYLIYAAEQILLISNEVVVVRVGDEEAVSDEQATSATVNLPAAGTIIQIESDLAGPYDFNQDSFFRWKLNGVLSSSSLVVLEGTYDVDELVEELNDQLDTTQDGIVFYVTSSNTIGVKTVWAYGPNSELELMSVKDAIYGGTVSDGNPTGLGTGMTQATITGTKSMYPDAGYQTPGVYDFTGLSDLNLQIVVDGTDNVNIDNVLQTIDLSDLEGQSNSLSDIVTEINSQRTVSGGSLPGGWVVSASGNNLVFKTLHHGRNARIRVKVDSTAEDIFGLTTTTASGLSPLGTTGDAADDTYGRVIGDTASSTTYSMTLTADSPGTAGNSTQVRVTNETEENTFIFEVFNNGVNVESFGNLTKDSTSTYYVQTYLTVVSDYIRATDITTVGAPPANGTYTLSGGSNGIPADADEQDALLIGSQTASTGIYTVSEPELYDIDLIAVPGHSSTSVVTALLNMAQNQRQDCLAIIDPPFGLTVDEVVQWQNGTHPLNTTRFNSDFGALYWPWVKIRDNTNRVDVWVPPSGSVMATIARSDAISAPWFAPAGLNRGVVPGITGVYQVPTREQRDKMYGNRNAVNPIVNFVGFEGYVIFGQKTLQRNPTALDRVNVRRLMFVIEKRIRQASRSLLFDPHDEVFRERFITIATNILQEIKVGRGIGDFIIKADDELNTSSVIDRNEFRANIGIQPIRAVEFMFIQFSLHRTGSFEENADTF